jgi:hypothetical protein
MTEHEMNEAFEAITGAEENADLAAVATPEEDDRKDGAYYHATVHGVTHYQVVVDHRVVAQVQISDVAVEPSADFAAIMQHSTLIDGTTFHRIAVATANGGTVIPTEGYTIKAPDGIFNRTLIKAYVMPRLPKLLVRLYGLGL